MLRLIAVLALFGATFSSALAADFPYGNFKPSNLSALQANEDDLIRLHPGVRPGDVTVHPPIRARVLVTFTGRHRGLDTLAAKFIGQYGFSMHAQPAWAPSFQEAYLFQSEGRDWWLPIQAPVAAYFAEEVKPGDPVNVYLVAAGSVRGDNGSHAIFLVEEFQTPANSP